MNEELKTAAIECLKKAFTGGDPLPEPHVVQAALCIVLESMKVK